MFRSYRDIMLLRVWFFGFANGLVLLLSGNTLNFWLSKEGISYGTIGAFSLVALPYSLKYFIALFIDKFFLPSFGMTHRKAWGLYSQLCLILILLAIGCISPKEHLLLMAILGFFIAFFSVIQDIILNAYRIEQLTQEQQGPGSAMYIFGYRIGMLISGSGAIYMSSFYEWGLIYGIMAFFVLILMLLFFVTKDPVNTISLLKEEKIKSSSFFSFFTEPFLQLGTPKTLIILLSFLILYRLSDNFLSTMSNPFLLHIGYNAIEISMAVKFFGTGASIIGGLVSGSIVAKKGVKYSLTFFCLLHTLCHFSYIIQYFIGYNVPFLFFLTAIESVTGGMAMTAYMSYISKKCKTTHTASHYALLTSFMGVSRVFFPLFSGMIVELCGWLSFFCFVILINIPTLLVINKL